jgi:hypothetical protein
MYTNDTARKMVKERGPRWAVYGQIRQGEARVSYALTSDAAETTRKSYEDDWGYYQVQVYPPDGSVELAQLGRERDAAKRTFDEKTEILKAGVLRALDEGRAEAEIARTAGVDRMTVRSWAGK